MTITVVEHRRHIIVRLIITYLYFRPGTRILGYPLFLLATAAMNRGVTNHAG